MRTKCTKCTKEITGRKIRLDKAVCEECKKKRRNKYARLHRVKRKKVDERNSFLVWQQEHRHPT